MSPLSFPRILTAKYIEISRCYLGNKYRCRHVRWWKCLCRCQYRASLALAVSALASALEEINNGQRKGSRTKIGQKNCFENKYMRKGERKKTESRMGGKIRKMVSLSRQGLGDQKENGNRMTKRSQAIKGEEGRQRGQRVLGLLLWLLLGLLF